MAILYYQWNNQKGNAQCDQFYECDSKLSDVMIVGTHR